MRKIRNIAIIHRDSDLSMLFYQIKNLLEKIRIKPAIELSLVQRTRDRPDTVKIKNTRTHHDKWDQILVFSLVSGAAAHRNARLIRTHCSLRMNSTTAGGTTRLRRCSVAMQ